MDNTLSSILKWYLYDTFSLIDCVLTDDVKDPQFSAVTALHRIKLYLCHILSREKIGSNEIAAFLLEHNYSQEDITNLYEKEKRENNT